LLKPEDIIDEDLLQESDEDEDTIISEDDSEEVKKD